jgi:hypothetical protein
MPRPIWSGGAFRRGLVDLAAVALDLCQIGGEINFFYSLLVSGLFFDGGTHAFPLTLPRIVVFLVSCVRLSAR